MECAYYFGGRHMECAYYFGGRHMECAYYFDLCRLCLSRLVAERRETIEALLPTEAEDQIWVSDLIGPWTANSRPKKIRCARYWNDLEP
jgi:hypothetical protein